MNPLRLLAVEFSHQVQMIIWAGVTDKRGVPFRDGFAATRMARGIVLSKPFVKCRVPLRGTALDPKILCKVQALIDFSNHRPAIPMAVPQAEASHLEYSNCSTKEKMAIPADSALARFAAERYFRCKASTVVMCSSYSSNRRPTRRCSGRAKAPLNSVFGRRRGSVQVHIDECTDHHSAVCRNRDRRDRRLLSPISLAEEPRSCLGPCAGCRVACAVRVVAYASPNCRRARLRSIRRRLCIGCNHLAVGRGCSAPDGMGLARCRNLPRWDGSHYVFPAPRLTLLAAPTRRRRARTQFIFARLPFAARR